MARWPKSHPEFFFFFYKKLKIKKLGAIWEVLETIGQIEKIWNFGGGELQKLKLWYSN
jgi:hypothetical protein